MFLVLILVLLLFPIQSTLADMGGIPVDPDVSVYEPGQKAVVAWNGTDEILILSTDVNASGSTLVLQMMPLPSQPNLVEKANFTSFEMIQWLMGYYGGLFFLGGEAGGEGVEITFHEKIGVHDITIVKSDNAFELAEWMEWFLSENGIALEISIQEFSVVVEDYIVRGFCFFLLDLIDFSAELKSAEPILLQFKTDFLYYPLIISSLFSGETKMTLFLLTNRKIEGDLPQGLRVSLYEDLSTVEFWVPNFLINYMDPRIGGLFKEGAWLTALEYEGDIKGFTKDLIIPPNPVTVYAWTDEALYRPGDQGTLYITVWNDEDRAITINKITVTFPWHGYIQDHWEGNVTISDINVTIASKEGTYNEELAFTIPSDGRAYWSDKAQIKVDTDAETFSTITTIPIATPTTSPTSPTTENMIRYLIIIVIICTGGILAIMYIAFRSLIKTVTRKLPQ